LKVLNLAFAGIERGLDVGHGELVGINAGLAKVWTASS